MSDLTTLGGAYTVALNMAFRWKRALGGVGLVLVLAAAAYAAFTLDRMALSYLTGQRRIPGESFFGDSLPTGGRVPGYAWLGASRPAPNGEGFIMARPWEAGREIGLQAGDRVLAVAGQSFSDSRELFRYLVSHHGADEVVRVDVDRSGERLEFDLRLKAFVRDPSDVGLDYEDVEFKSGTGLLLRGWWIPPPDGTDGRSVIFVHGAKSSRFQAMDGAPYWHRRGYGLLTMDLSGRGASDGEYVTYSVNERKDVASMLEWSRHRVGGDANRVFLFGTSNGAAASIYAAAEDGHVPAVALDAPFGNLWEAAASELKLRGMPAGLLYPLSWAVRWRAGIELSAIRPADVIDRIQAPILFIHGDADDRVPLSQTESMVGKRREARLPTELWVIPGGEHGFDNYPPPEVLWNRVADFFDRTLQPSTPPADALAGSE